MVNLQKLYVCRVLAHLKIARIINKYSDINNKIISLLALREGGNHLTINYPDPYKIVNVLSFVGLNSFS